MVSECEIPAAQLLTEKPDKALARPGVYAILCDANGRYYMGGSGNIRARFNCHRGSLRGNRHKNPHMASAYQMFGESRFIFKVLEFCNPSEVISFEQKWINALDSARDGFNIRHDAAGRPARPSDKLILAMRSIENRSNLNKFELISPNGDVHAGVNLKKFCKEHGLPQGNMHGVVTGRLLSCLGWRKNGGRTRTNNAWAIEKEYSLVSPLGELYVGKNISLFARKMKLTGTSLVQVMLGKQSNHKGWRKSPCT
jgi:hypothetical protein